MDAMGFDDEAWIRCLGFSELLLRTACTRTDTGMVLRGFGEMEGSEELPRQAVVLLAAVCFGFVRGQGAEAAGMIGTVRLKDLAEAVLMRSGRALADLPDVLPPAGGAQTEVAMLRELHQRPKSASRVPWLRRVDVAAGAAGHVATLVDDPDDATAEDIKPLLVAMVAQPEDLPEYFPASDPVGWVYGDVAAQ